MQQGAESCTAAHKPGSFALALRRTPCYRAAGLHAKNSLKILRREALQTVPALLVGVDCGMPQSTNTSGHPLPMQGFFGGRV